MFAVERIFYLDNRFDAGEDNVSPIKNYKFFFRTKLPFFYGLRVIIPSAFLLVGVSGKELMTSEYILPVL